MRLALTVTILFMMLLLAGCGAERQVYMHPQLGTQDEDRDYHNCMFEAQKATGNLTDSDDREDRIDEMIDSCMRSKGYTR